MTEREAIEAIKPIEQSARATSCGGFEQRPIVTALQMAISALEKQNEFLSNIDNYIEVTNGDGEYFKGMRNGMRFCKNFFDGEEPQYE